MDFAQIDTKALTESIPRTYITVQFEDRHILAQQKSQYQIAGKHLYVVSDDRERPPDLSEKLEKMGRLRESWYN